MPADTTFDRRRPNVRLALLLAGVSLISALAIISMVYKHGVDFTCHENWSAAVCRGVNGVLLALYACAALLGLFTILSPDPVRRLVSDAGWSRVPLAFAFAGLLVALVPATFLAEGSGTTQIPQTLLFWLPGFAMLLGGILAFVAPLSRWRGFLSERGGQIAAILLAGAAAPQIAMLIRPLWGLEAISGFTFTAVARALDFFGYALETDPVRRVIGTEEFKVSVASVCSGIEGIALVTVFTTIFLILFRNELRFPRALLIYPVGICISAALNIVRISVLLVIGMEGYPELAVGAFHSHAGWLMFTLISVGIVLGARRIPALQRPLGPVATTSLSAPPPLREDPNAARIMPFAVFMFTGLFAQAFSQTPGVVYPLRVVAMAAVLLYFARAIRGLKWGVSVEPVMAGLAIGIMWVSVPYHVADPSPAYAGLAGAWLVGWMILRAIGTMLLVPVIEELFFRDYLEGKLTGALGPWFAAFVTAGLFAALHDRWMEALVAGLVFSWIMQRRGRVSDAIVAHAVANAIVFAYAFATGQMHII
ncbi:exosortase E/protease, VPEID-CTERM system [Sulfitobacter sp. LCG007]